MADEDEVREAVETIAEAAGDAVSAEAAIEAAQERAEAAEELAEEIVEAALESERGRRIDQLERDLSQWRSEHATQLESLTATVQEMNQRVMTSLEEIRAQTVTVVTAQAPVTDQPLIPPNSETPETVTAVTVSPGAAGDAPEAPAPAPARKKARWL